ncbi:HPr Serine kinase C-terminal domain-containing protein [Limimaricola pyoseonensis]|uniref:HPr Serine kinase C-terminal domain-containing protein n=1 Tax=Limimaricola pyoseonensis TaxID=521013 RepID=A0A1G7I2L4_9RHOB|nr:HPr Serine kinase C-terminal domain-containing protein [Limimaricola pyoseonensis]
MLVTGPSGSGKSALALALIGLGCQLVADDRTRLALAGGALWASCPPAIRGLIEARGAGLLFAPPLPAARLVLAAALDRPETERLPPERCVTYMGRSLPLLHNIGTDRFAQAILQYLKAGRREP